MLDIQQFQELNALWNSKYSETDYLIFFMDHLNKDRKYFMKQNDKGVSGFYLLEYSYIILHDKKIKIAKVMEVVEHPQLMQEVMDYVSRNTLITLMPLETHNYEMYGFEIVGESVKYRVSGVDIPDFPIKGILLDPSIQKLYHIYNLFTAHFNGSEAYNFNKFEEYINRYKKMGAEIIAYEFEGEILGYSIYTKNKYLVDIKEICYDSANTLLQMISYLSKGIGYVEMNVSGNEQITRIIPSARFSKEPRLLARINDKELFERLYGIKILGAYSGIHAFGKPLWNQRNL